MLRSKTVGVVLALLAIPAFAHAFQDRSTGMYVEGGGTAFGDGNASTYALGAGVLLPWSPSASFSSGAQSLYWDLFLGNWSAPGENGGRSNFAQVGAILNWRYRFAGGNSPWFTEVGAGGSLMDRTFHTQGREFSTNFQFTEILGVGVSLGEHGQHELGVRIQHFSNADIKKPNPGETFVRARYTYRF